MKQQSIIVATHSRHKLAEIQSYFFKNQQLSNHYQFKALSEISNEKVLEDGISFVENALIKARHASKICNQAALADDSGLCVEALNGSPGIYSSRFASLNGSKLSIEGNKDQQNNQYLLEKLKDFTRADQRRAYFVTVLVWLKSADDPDPIIVQSYLYGRILKKQRGNFGFGYDPLFYLPEMKKTLAEIPLAEKNQISHRAKALMQLTDRLEHLIGQKGKRPKGVISQNR